MGVKGLWKLLQPTSRLVKLDCLEGTKLSVDLSIWLHQAIHARVVAAISGSGEPRMHLQVLFHRLLKLLFYGIRAVFVFDGPEVSTLKKRTQLLRRLRVNQATLNSRKTHAKLVKHLAAAAVHSAKSPTSLEQEACSSLSSSNDTSNDSCVTKDVSSNGYSLLEVADGIGDKPDGPLSPKRSCSPTLWDGWAPFDLPSSSSIDPQRMAALPNELRFQIYASEKSAACSLEDLPEDSTDFSAAQMKRLVNRSELGEKMNRLRNEIILSDPVIALSLSGGQADINLVRLRKMLSRDQKHHVLLEDERTISVKERDDQTLNVQPSAHISGNGLTNTLKAAREDATTSITAETSPVEEEALVASDRRGQNEDAMRRSDEIRYGSSTSTKILGDQSSAGDPTSPSTVSLPFQHVSSEQVPNHGSHLNIPLNHSTDDSDDFIEVEDLPEHTNELFLLNSQPTARPPSPESITSTSSSFKDASSESDQEDNIEFARRERMHSEATERNVSSQILDECEVLIKSFGMPVVKGPAEAEAQCAWLEENHFTEGTITDDSDIWLFGGRRVYRNLFNVKKTVERFDMNSITNTYGLDRERLVLLAMLVGCDYTVGVEGIGAVTATEIIAEFEPTKEDETPDRLECLRRFRAWCERTVGNDQGDPDEPITRGRFAKLAHCQFPGSFPDSLIFDAFLRPRVDRVDERTLSWNLPDVDKIRNLTSNWFGWSKEETDRHLLPVVKRAASLQSRRQRRIDDFCTTVGPTLPPDSQGAPLSQRVKRATSRLKATVNKRKRRQSPQTSNISSKLAGWCPSEADKPRRRRPT